MKEIMDTSLVEGYIFFFEVLDMVGKECQHILLAVIGFLAQCLVGQCADTAVALQCALAYLEQHAQILIVEKADAFRDSRLFPLSLHRQQQFVLTVEPFHQLLHPALEVVSCEQFHDLCPPSFGVAARAQRVVAFQFLRCRRVLVDGTLIKQAVDFRLPVAAFAAKHDIADALLAAHTLEGELPTPHFVVFYNGEKEREAEGLLKLSHSFMQKTEHPELELLVKVLNINLDKNLEILETCRLLKEYMLLVHKIRQYAIEYKDINQAAEKAVTECIDENILAEFLRKNRAEAIEVCIFEYDEKRETELIRKAEFAEGEKVGEAKGEAKILLNLIEKGILTKEQALEQFGGTYEDLEKAALSVTLV